MRILVVAATPLEIAGFRSYVAGRNRHEVSSLITGAGMLATTWELCSFLKAAGSTYDVVINAGIAGAYDHTLAAGKVVRVTKEIFADFGAENDAQFLPASVLGLLKKNEFPFLDGWLVPGPTPYEDMLPFTQVTGITVNTVSGSQQTIMSRQRLFSPQVESMEGAAFFYACLRLQQPCLQLRSISNRVEIRNRSNWNIPLAVENLNKALTELYSNLPA